MKMIMMCLVVIFSLIGCNSTNEPAGHDGHDHGSVLRSPDTVVLTADQERAAGITLQHPRIQKITSNLVVRGSLHVPPQNMLSVTAPLGGTIRQIQVLPGDHVRKGATLAVLEDPEFISLQEAYLTNKSKLDIAELELQRQQTLAADNISARKQLEQAKAEVNILRIAQQAASERLSLLGIVATNLTSTTISGRVPIKAPFDGYVTEVFVNTGTAVEPRGKILDFVNPTHLHVELQVFESDASRLRPEQTMTVQVTGDTTKRSAHVHLIGTAVDANRTVVVHAHLDKPDVSLRPGTSVTATVAVTPHNELTVPRTAVVTVDHAQWVYVKVGDGAYRRVAVDEAMDSEAFVILRDTTVSATDEVVVSGAQGILQVLRAKP